MMSLEPRHFMGLLWCWPIPHSSELDALGHKMQWFLWNSVHLRLDVVSMCVRAVKEYDKGQLVTQSKPRQA